MNLTTLSENLRIARNEGNEDGTGANQNGSAALDLTTVGDYANRPSVLGSSGVGVIDILQPDGTEEEVSGHMKANGIEFMFTAGSAAAKTFGWRLLGWRVKGPARLAAVGTGETGTQAVVTYPHNGATATNKFWADKLVVTWTNMPKGVEATDSGGNSNSVGSVWLDDCGYRYWKVEITDADGVTGAEAGDVAVWYGFW